jgi:hypothetical protein
MDEAAPAHGRAAAHISDPEWQSFESRMRARRAERCLQRAATAIHSGSITEARDALDEARVLSPADPRVDDLQMQLDSLSRPAIEVESKSFSTAELDLLTTPDVDVLDPIIAEPEPSGFTTLDNHAVGAFEPVHSLDLDSMRTPALEGWSGVALAPPSREWNRTTSVVTIGLLMSALVGWQAWGHREELISHIPSAHPDVDSSTGLAAGTPRAEPATLPVAHDAPPPAIVPAAQPNPEPLSEEGMTATPRREKEVTLASTPRAAGTAGDHASLEAANRRSALNPLSSGLTSPVVRKTPEQRTEPPSGAAQRLPGVNPVAAVTENRAAAPATDTTPTTSAPAATTPPAVTPLVPSVDAPVNSPTSRTEPAPSLPSEPPPSTPSSPAPTVASRDQSAAIRAALNRYEAAYNRLDVASARSVWPSLDQHALSRAFESLASQRVSLGNCSVIVTGTAARADCSGTAAWTPKVGGSERKSSRKWTFDLTESDGAWRIVRVQAR